MPVVLSIVLCNQLIQEAEGAQSMTAGISETVVASSTPDVKVEGNNIIITYMCQYWLIIGIELGS